MTEAAFTQRVMDMRTKLYHTARALLWNNEDAADAVQEAMLRAWKKRGSLRDEGSFEAWFYRIFIRQCRDMQRQQIRRRKALEEAAREPSIYGAQEGRDVWEALCRLGEKYRLPLMLCAVQGYSQKEAAAILGITPEQVKARTHRARQKLRAILEEGDEVDGGKGL